MGIRPSTYMSPVTKIYIWLRLICFIRMLNKTNVVNQCSLTILKLMENEDTQILQTVDVFSNGNFPAIRIVKFYRYTFSLLVSSCYPPIVLFFFIFIPPNAPLNCPHSPLTSHSPSPIHPNKFLHLFLKF